MVAYYSTIVLDIDDRAWQCVQWCDILLSSPLVMLLLLYGCGFPHSVFWCLSWLGIFEQRGSIHYWGRGVLACVLLIPIQCKCWWMLPPCWHLSWISWSVTMWCLIYTHTPRKYSSYLHRTVLVIFQLGHCRLFLSCYWRYTQRHNLQWSNWKIPNTVLWRYELYFRGVCV